MVEVDVSNGLSIVPDKVSRKVGGKRKGELPNEAELGGKRSTVGVHKSAVLGDKLPECCLLCLCATEVKRGLLEC